MNLIYVIYTHLAALISN